MRANGEGNVAIHAGEVWSGIPLGVKEQHVVGLEGNLEDGPKVRVGRWIAGDGKENRPAAARSPDTED